MISWLVLNRRQQNGYQQLEHTTACETAVVCVSNVLLSRIVFRDTSRKTHHMKTRDLI